MATVQLEQSKTGWQEKTSLEAKQEPWADCTGNSALLSHRQATQIPLDAGVSTSLSRSLTNTYMTFRERTLNFFFFPRRSFSIFLVNLYPLAHRMFLGSSHWQQTEKRKEEALYFFILAPWCRGMKPGKENSILDKPSSSTYLTVPVVQLQFTCI